MPKPPGESKRVAWGWIAAVFGAAVAAYLPALGAGFIWNDRDYVTPPPLRSLAGLGRIWFEVGATQQYYPVLHTAFWIEHLLWGDSAFGYHLANVLLHATAACLFALVLRQWAKPSGAAWLAALIFALHPVGVESVAWISEQKNTLSAVFYLLAALHYLRFEPKRKEPGAKRGYLLATGFFILALLSKSVTATLPATLLVVLWWRRGTLAWRRDVAPLLLWFVLGAAIGLFTAWFEHSIIGARGSDFDLGLPARSLIAGRAVWFYLGKLFWPADLIFIYPRWDVDPEALGQWLFPVGVVAVLGLFWAWRRRWRAPLALGLIFVGTLFPVLGFLNVYAFVFSFVADHFQYLASLGVIGGVVVGLSSFRPAGADPTSPAGCGLRRASKQIAAGAAICLLASLTWRQCRLYRDSETLYRALLARNPECWMAHDNLGTILRQSGRIGEAVYHYEQALWLKPGFAEGHNNLGVALIDSGHKPEAIAQLEKAVRLRPDFPEAEDNLGSALASSGRIPEALAILERLVKKRPDLAEAHGNYGLALAHAGRLAEADAECREALRLDPGSAAARRNLAFILRSLGSPAGGLPQN